MASLVEMLSHLSPGNPQHHRLADAWLLSYVGSRRVAELHRYVTGSDALDELAHVYPASLRSSAAPVHVEGAGGR